MSKKGRNYSNPKEIAKFVIEQTPIGLLDSSLKSLKVLLKEEVLKSPEILKEIKLYKENHFMAIPVTVNEVSTNVIISSINKDSDEYYYDQGKKIRFKLNARNEVEKIEEYESKNETRKAIEKKLIQYIEKYYNKNYINYNVYYDSIVDKIHIILSGQITNDKNFISGEWLSTWELDLNDKKVAGGIKINIIYYEDGNVQFNFGKKYETRNNGRDDESIADELISFVEKNENEIQKKMDEDNEDFSEKYIRPLRKRVSLIGKDMNWSLDQIQFHLNQFQ